jgi:hypothetical protein
LTILKSLMSPGSRVPRTPTPDVGNSYNGIMCYLNRPFQSSPELLSISTNLFHSPAPTLKSKKIRKAVAKSRFNVSSHSDEPTLLADRVTLKKKKGPSKKTSIKITREEWQFHLMRNIMLDTDLHLRILRYEV